MSLQNKNQTPFPTIGEILKFVFEALDLKVAIEDKKLRGSLNKDLERFAREKNFDLQRASEIIDNLFSEFKDILPPTLCTHMKKVFLTFLTEYKNLVLYIPSGTANRDSIIAVLLPEFFLKSIATYQASLFQHCTEIDIRFPRQDYWYLPEIDQDTNKIMTSFEKVFSWWQEISPEANLRQLAKTFYDRIKFEGYEERNNAGYKQMRRWIKNENLPSSKSILDIYKALSDTETEQNINVRSLAINLLIARFIQYCCNVLQPDIFEDLIGVIKQHPEQKSYRKTDLDTIWSYIDRASPGVDRKEILEIFNSKCEDLEHLHTSLKKVKQPGQYKMAKDILHEIKKTPINPYYDYYIHWQEGRYFVLLGHYEEGLKCYKKSFEKAKLRAGAITKEIIREGITLAAYLDERSAFKSMYKWAQFYELFTDSYTEVQDWIIDHQKKQFQSIFPPENFYPEGQEKQKISDLHKERLRNILIDNLERWEKRSPDLQNPDRWIKGFGPRPLTQLMIFGGFGQINKVDRLLKRGADPNLKATDNLTALIRAIQNEHYEVAFRLLNEDLSQSINTQTSKHHTTALQAAIDCAHVGLVEELIKKGADIHQRCSTNGDRGQSPLYYCLQAIGIGNMSKEELTDHIQSYPDDVIKAMNRNDLVKILGNVLFDDELANVTLPWKHPNFPLGEMLPKRDAQIPGLREIITLLINAGADTNEKHDHGFTPLLLCAEVGDCEIFTELANMGGDLSATTEDGQTVHSIANSLSHFELVRLLKQEYGME